MLRSTMLLGLAGVLVAGCSQQLSRQEIAVEEQRVRERVTGWARAIGNRDTGELAAFYHQVPELTVAWMSGTRTRGWEEERETQRQFFRSIARANLVISDLSVEILSATVALTTFRHSSDIIKTSTDRDIFSGNGTIVWMRDETDNLWKIHAAQISRNPPDM